MELSRRNLKLLKVVNSGMGAGPHFLITGDIIKESKEAGYQNTGCLWIKEVLKLYYNGMIK